MRLGKRAWVSSNGPICRARSALIFGSGKTQCGLPTVRGAEIEFLPAQMDRLVDDLAVRTDDGNFIAPKTYLAHLDTHDLAAFRDGGFHHATRVSMANSSLPTSFLSQR